MNMGVYLFLLLFALMFSGMSIALGVGMAAVLTTGVWGQIGLGLILQQYYQGVNSLALLAVPLFMLAGKLMTRLGLVDGIILLVKLLVGRMRGLLAQINIVASVSFSTMSGPAVANTTIIGGMPLSAMEKEGYDEEFFVAVTAVFSIIGPIIPPSIIMIVYGSLISNVPAGVMFVTDIAPDALIRLGEMALVYYFSRKCNYSRETKRYTAKEASAIAVRTFPAVFTPVVIVAAIFPGFCSATEAACIANIWALITGALYYRWLNLKVSGGSVIVVMETAEAILLLSAAAKPLSYLIAMAQLSTMISEVFTSFTSSRIVTLLPVNVALLFLGCSMECTADALIFTPIFAPLAISFGVGPLQFVLTFAVNAVCGICTPPFDPMIFLAAGIVKAPLERCMKAIISFCVVQIAVILMIFYIPAPTLTLSWLLGLYQSMGMAEEAICRSVSAFQWQDIPEAVKGCARRCLTDAMAYAISGGKSVQFRAAEAVIDQNHASRHYLAGQGLEQANLYDGVLFNICAAHPEEYNDLFFGRSGYPSVVLAPVVLGLGFSQNVSVNSVMESYVAGLEVMALVNQALLPSAHGMGSHTTSVTGTVGAAAAADKLLYLPQDGLEWVLSIACTFAYGLRADLGTLANVLHVGNAAAAGLRAVQFATVGFYTGMDLLSGSFLTYYGGSHEQLEILTGSLGRTWAFLEPGLLIKEYPCCFSNYQAIGTALNITEIPGFSYDRIEQVICLTSENHFMPLPVFRPDIPHRARLCIPYCATVALLQGNIDKASFSEKMPHNTALPRCRDRIRHDVDPRQRGEEGFEYSRVIVAQDSGQRSETMSWLREEERAQYWGEEFLKNKFLNCCAWTLSKTQAQRVYGVCMYIDELREISELLCVLRRNEMLESG